LIDSYKINTVKTKERVYIIIHTCYNIFNLYLLLPFKLLLIERIRGMAKNVVCWFRKEESGQGMVEYALIIALIAIVAIVALKLLGGKVFNIFSNANNKL
jgi:pilus assembly protein Flp/PilA